MPRPHKKLKESLPPEQWRAKFAEGVPWEDLRKMECKQCSEERHRRNRLLEEADERARQEPFARAPFIHKKQ